jgi:hypothetical protein
MNCAKITLGKFVERGCQNPPYVELYVVLEEGQSAIVMIENYIITTCSTVKCKFYGDYDDRVSDYRRIVRISKENLCDIDSNTMVATFKFRNGLIEKHTFGVPTSIKWDTIQSSVEVDSTNLVPENINFTVNGVDEVDEIPEERFYNFPSYYDVMKKVEKKNGAFECIM